MDAVVLITVAVLAAALGIVLGRYVWPAVRASDRDALATAQTDLVRLNQEGIALRSRAEQLDAERKAAADEVRTAGHEVARLTERVAGLTKQTEEQTKQTTTLEVQREAAANEAKAAVAEVARLTEREIALSDKIETLAAQLADQQKQLTVEFENIANRILKTNATEL